MQDNKWGISEYSVSSVHLSKEYEVTSVEAVPFNVGKGLKYSQVRKEVDFENFLPEDFRILELKNNFSLFSASCLMNWPSNSSEGRVFKNGIFYFRDASLEFKSFVDTDIDTAMEKNWSFVPSLGFYIKNLENLNSSIQYRKSLLRLLARKMQSATITPL